MAGFRLGVVVTHPIQYQAPLYKELARRGHVVPHVLFLSHYGVEQSYDRQFGRFIAFDVPLLDGYAHEFVRNWSPRASLSPGADTFNPGLLKAIRRAELDAVVIHGYAYLSAWLAYGSARVLGLPYLMRGESNPDVSHGIRQIVKHRLVEPLVTNAAGLLSIGMANRDFYLQYGAEEGRIFHAPYSVDTTRFRRDGEAGRAARAERLDRLGLNPGLPTLLFAAKFVPWKRPFDPIEAVDLLGGTVNLIMIGDGPLKSALEERATKRPWMRVLGFVNQIEIAFWYGAADVFVLPSEHEPWGLAVNEAMAAGSVPIVSDAVGCARDLVAPQTGRTFPTGNIAALATCIVTAAEMSSDESTRQRIIDRSEDYGIAATCRGFEEAAAAIALAKE